MPWSPSSTQAFLNCPMAWYMARQGAVGRVMDTTAMDQGTAFHAALANIWAHNGSEPRVEDPNLRRVVQYTMDQEGVALAEQAVVGWEVNLGGPPEEAARHGRYNGTCDLVTENDSGLTVTDYKTKAKMDARFADPELRQTQRSWQLRQYAWFVQEKYSRPVTKIRKLLVAFTPVLKVWLVEYPVTQTGLLTWHAQAEEVWYQMDLMVDYYNDVLLPLPTPVQNPDACERYGWAWRCQFYETCWDGKELTYAIRET